jgi:hypothetical protein
MSALAAIVAFASGTLAPQATSSKRRTSSHWTAAEDDLLRRHYQKGHVARCAKYLPHRTNEAISSRARRLGLQKHRRATL